MLIDWFTVIAQVINFLILVWLMKRFLYKPILNAIDAREKQVAAELADAASQKAAAQQEHAEFDQKNSVFEQQRAELLRKATDDAQAERQRLLADARQAGVALRAKQQETLRNEERNLQQAISRRTQQEVFAITRQALTDLAGATLEERMSAVFTRRLGALDDQAKAGLAKALKSTADPALVRSAFELPAEQRTLIQTALNETFSADPSTPLRAGIPLRFETAPSLISGIELTANGQKIAWSIADYLTSLEKGVDELLQAKEKPAVNATPNSAPKPEPTPAPRSQ